MRLPRNVKMLRGPMDAAALAGTVFLLWIATFLHSSLVLPPGVRLRLPDAPGVWGEVLPHLTVAVDASQPGGRLFFEHQLITESNLQVRLRERVAAHGSHPVLLLLADRDVTTETLARLVTLTRAAGVAEVVLGTSPRPDPAPESSTPPRAAVAPRSP